MCELAVNYKLGYKVKTMLIITANEGGNIRLHARKVDLDLGG